MKAAVRHYIDAEGWLYYRHNKKPVFIQNGQNQTHVFVEEGKPYHRDGTPVSRNLQWHNQQGVFIAPDGQQVIINAKKRLVFLAASDHKVTAREPYTTTQTAQGTSAPDAKTKAPIHWTIPVGVAMIILLFGVIAYTQVIAPEIQAFQDSSTPTYQTDAVVGHNDSIQDKSHFVVINLHGQAVIVEFPGGDPAKTQIYPGPQWVGTGAASEPFKIKFEEVQGKIYMIIFLAHDSNMFWAYKSQGGRFVPTTPSESPQIK
jgi:hypothetical protein